MTTQPIITVCSLVLMIVPAIFVWHKVYHDGVVGRLALGGMSVAAGIVLLKILFDAHSYAIPPEIVAMMSLYALFLCWHLWRFHRRVLRRDQCQPDCEADRRRVADRRYR